MTDRCEFAATTVHYAPETWDPGYRTDRKCGPIKVVDCRFRWWYRAWLWLKAKFFRRKCGYWYARYVAFPKPISLNDKDVTVLYRKGEPKDLTWEDYDAWKARFGLPPREKEKENE